MHYIEPTDEQEDAMGLFASEQDMAIEAGAGTGKTATLVMLAEMTKQSDQTGQYVTFGRAAVGDAMKRMPMTVRCSTIHSLSARATSRDLLNRLESRREPSWVAAKNLRIDRGVYFSVDGKPRVLAPSWLAGHVMRALDAFCWSDDLVPALHHFPVVLPLDTDPAMPNNLELAKLLLPALDRAWADSQVASGVLRYSHDRHLKAWALTEPQLPVDFVLIDEAQDLSPVQIGIFADQKSTQRVWVGDACQQIYEWRGAINALAHIDTGCRSFLTQSFRFGPEIADVANRVLDALDADLRLTGAASHQSQVNAWHWSKEAEASQAMLCRTNAVSVETMLGLQAHDVPVHLVGGGGEVLQFAYAAAKLQETGTCEHRELGCFGSWRAVQEYVSDDPLGAELKLLVDLVDRFGADTIIEALDDMIAEDQAQVVVSTAHKAKGREWDVVRLASDFADLAASGDADLRLLYVALTRAREWLDPFYCEAFQALTR